jgi:hypothetical protein
MVKGSASSEETGGAHGIGVGKSERWERVPRGADFPENRGFERKINISNYLRVRPLIGI